MMNILRKVSLHSCMEISLFKCPTKHVLDLNDCLEDLVLYFNYLFSTMRYYAKCNFWEKRFCNPLEPQKPVLGFQETSLGSTSCRKGLRGGVYTKEVFQWDCTAT